MQEIEVKIIEINKEEIIRKLESLGAKKIFEGDMESRMMDFPDHHLWADKKTFRLRKEGEETRLTLKNKETRSEGVKNSEEIEISISEINLAEKILENIGLYVYAQFKKNRTSYELGKVRYEIDEYEGVPPLLELQAESKEELEAALTTLGYELKDTTSWSWKQVLEHYGKSYSPKK